MSKFLILFLLSINVLFAQKRNKIFKRELHLQIDNDYFSPVSSDKYYTSGVRLTYRILANENSWIHNLFNRDFPGKEKNTIVNITLGHHIYTPNDITELDVNQFDRPYAGWVYLETGLSTFLNPKLRLAINLDGGLIGPINGVGEFQEWYHKQFKLSEPKGWKYQVQNGVAINLRSEINYEWISILDKNITVIPNASFRIGTLFDNLKIGTTIKFLNFGALSRSTFFHSKLKKNLNKLKLEERKEVYLFYTYNYEYVIYNGLIEGNVLGSESHHLEIIQPNVHHHKYGLAISGVRLDWHFSINKNTNETLEAVSQTYGTVETVFRF